MHSSSPVADVRADQSSVRRLLRRHGAALVVGALFVGFILIGVVPQLQARHQWANAQTALLDDDYAVALQHLKDCQSTLDHAILRFWPFTAWLDSGELSFAMARTARRAEDYGMAKRELLRAEEAGWPKDALATENLLLEAENGDFFAVEPTLKAKLAVPDHQEELVLEALVKGCLRNHRFTDADGWGRQWQQSYPEAWKPHYLRGQAWELMPKLDRAAAEYARVLELKPNHLDALFRLGDVRRRLDQYDVALPYLQRAYQRNASDPLVLASLLRCLRSMGQNQAANDLVTQWLETHHVEHPVILALKARLAYDAQRLDEAFAWFKRAEKVAPNDEEVIRGLEALHRDRGETEEAERYKRRGDDVYAKMNRLDLLMKQFHENPDDVAPQLEIGRLLQTLNYEEPAVHWYKSVIQLDPQNKPAHLLLADYYDRSGDRETAHMHRAAAEGKVRAKVRP